MTNHSSLNTVIVRDPADGYVRLIEAMGGRMMELPEVVRVDPFQIGVSASEVHGISPRIDPEED